MNMIGGNDAWLWDKVVEVYRARISLSLAFVVATVSLAGYAIAYQQPGVALLTSVVPLLALAIDVLMIYKIAAPFLYKIFSSQSETLESEPLVLLFLAFGSSSSTFRELWSMPPGIERQKLFRAAYLKEEVLRRIGLFVGAALGGVLLWALMPKG
jgi:hypothetical protein